MNKIRGVTQVRNKYSIIINLIYVDLDRVGIFKLDELNEKHCIANKVFNHVSLYNDSFFEMIDWFNNEDGYQLVYIEYLREAFVVDKEWFEKLNINLEEFKL